MDWRAALLAAASIGLLALAAYLPPIPQPPKYHDFAAVETVLGIPRFGDVFSNVAFLLVGLLGISWVLRHRHPSRRRFLYPVDAWPYLVFFVAVTLVGAGSAYYHWSPDNFRLYWDRLAMTVGFMSVFAAILGERAPPRTTAIALPLLVLLGAAGATHWLTSELLGAGDLRLYLLTQGLPLILGPVLILLYRSRYHRGLDFVAAGGWYLLALLAENRDHTIHALTGGWLSGHTLKHLLAAMAIYWILRMLQRRQPNGPTHPS